MLDIKIPDPPASPSLTSLNGFCGRKAQCFLSCVCMFFVVVHVCFFWLFFLTISTNCHDLAHLLGLVQSHWTDVPFFFPVSGNIGLLSLDANEVRYPCVWLLHKRLSTEKWGGGGEGVPGEKRPCGKRVGYQRIVAATTRRVSFCPGQ